MYEHHNCTRHTPCLAPSGKSESSLPPCLEEGSRGCELFFGPRRARGQGLGGPSVGRELVKSPKLDMIMFLFVFFEGVLFFLCLVCQTNLDVQVSTLLVGSGTATATIALARAHGSRRTLFHTLFVSCMGHSVCIDFEGMF